MDALLSRGNFKNNNTKKIKAMTTIETTNGIFSGEEIIKSQLPRSAKMIGLGYLKLEGLYNFDPFTEIKWYTTNKKRYLIINKTN